MARSFEDWSIHVVQAHFRKSYYTLEKEFVISTSRHGPGQIQGSNRTPLGLHRIRTRIGAGHPVGTVFKARQQIGFTWQGLPEATIAHRLIWLEGLEDGLNRGGEVDSYRRYIYIHGIGDEPTLGRPASAGCIHMAAKELMPLFDALKLGDLVWITNRPLRALMARFPRSRWLRPGR